MSESSKYIINLNYIIIGMLAIILLMLLYKSFNKQRHHHGHGCRCRECKYSSMLYAENYETDN